MNRARRVSLGSAAAFAVLCALASSAAAQVNNEGFALNRFDPSERGSDWFTTESLDLRGDGRFAFGLVGDWSHNPLVLFDTAGNEIAPVVADQIYLHFGAALTLADRVRFGLSLPLALVNSGTPGVFMGSTFALDEGVALGDLRLGADLRLFGEYGDAITGALGLRVHLPTGSRGAFTGDGSTRIVPRFSIAGEISSFAYGAHVGTNIRTQNENFAGEPFGTELAFGASAGLWFGQHALLVGPELQGTTVLSDSGKGAFERKTTPLEILLGGHYRMTQQWRLGAGVGPGLSRGFGAPAVRVLVSIEWVDDVEKAKEPEPSDRDRDGILDDDDACPDVPGVASDDAAKNGCPLAKDRDHDGILDDDDACPDDKGVRSDDPAKNGCPAPKDRDKDGIFDDDDACPNDKGEANENPKRHGCPKAVIQAGQIKILERIEFDTGKATIRPESSDVLEAVHDILAAHAEIELVRIEGHTDDRGGDAANMKLSQQRADAVKKWLTDHDIDVARLQAKGFGETHPIETNDTDEGRQDNRRVEFHIEKQKDSDTQVDTH